MNAKVDLEQLSKLCAERQKIVDYAYHFLADAKRCGFGIYYISLQPGIDNKRVPEYLYVSTSKLQEKVWQAVWDAYQQHVVDIEARINQLLEEAQT